MASDASADIIPASQRPDGTWRKERKVKPGYVPPEEAEKYESKTVRFLNEKPIYPPGFVPPSVDQKKGLSKNQKKNERKKQKKKEKTEIDDTPELVEVTEKISQLKTNEVIQVADDPDINVDVAKKKKGLLKKLKQIQQLEERQAKGEVLEKEQLEKINKKKEFEEELEELT